MIIACLFNKIKLNYVSNVYHLYFTSLSIPLKRMKSARRSLEDLDVSRNAIARRWGTGGYGSSFPEEPITNYLDVCK